ncbi:hypothetical protein GIB67_015935, partial [Kingdonia uniflora]
RVPDAFVQRFNGNFPTNVFLVSSAGRSWEMSMKKFNNDLVFRRGWQAFVRDHSLEVGDFLVFRYDGCSKFYVKIYGRTACEKEITLDRRNNGDKINSAAAVQGGFVQPERKHWAALVQPKNTFIIEHGRKRTKGATICFYMPIRRKNMLVPVQLAEESNLVTKESAMLQDPKGRLWPVKINLWENGNVNLGRGWKDFWKANLFREGLRCKFEFDREEGPEGFVIKVSPEEP